MLEPVKLRKGKVLLVASIFLLVFSSLCITEPSSETSTPRAPSEIEVFLSSARERLEECNSASREVLVSGDSLKYLNMSILNSTMVEVEGKIYRYAVLGIWNVSLSGEGRLGEYRITWKRPENVTTTGGQVIIFRIYRDDTRVGSFTRWIIPFQRASYCLAVESRSITLADKNTLVFVFIQNGPDELWLVLERQNSHE